MRVFLRASLNVAVSILMLAVFAGIAQAQPTFSSTPVTTATVASPYTYAISATDPSNTVLNFSAITKPAWLTLNNNGQSTATQFGGSVGTQPSGVAGDPAGNVYVSSSSTTISRIAPDGTTTAWFTRQAGLAYALYVYNGFLYISYYTNNVTGQSCITKVNLANPTTETTVYTSGLTADYLAMTYSGGFFYVAAYGESKIRKINSTTLAASDVVTVSTPWGVCFNSSGILYIASINNGVYTYNLSTSTLTLVQSIPYCYDVILDANDNVYVGGYQFVRKYVPNMSSFVSVYTPVSYVLGMNITPTGALVFGDYGTSNIFKLQTGASLTGTPALSDIGNNPVTIRVSNGTTTTDQSFTIAVTGPPTISAMSNVTKNYGDAAFTITNPTSNSAGAFSYGSSNTAVATVSGNTVTIVGAGTATITATQAANGFYLTGTQTFTVTVNPIAPVFGAFANQSKLLSTGSYTITAPGSTSPGAITYTSSNTSVATISGTTVTLVGTGTSTITANQAATTNYTAASTTSVLTVNNLITLNNIGLTASTPALTAYSLRKLGSAYTGAAVRVRRSSDNAEADIAFDASGLVSATSVATIKVVGTSGLTLNSTQSFGTFYGSVNGFVSILYDQSGNGNDATQTNAGNQPQIVAAGVITTSSFLNNKPCLTFDATAPRYMNIPFAATLIDATGTFATVHSQGTLQSGYNAILAWTSISSVYGPGFAPLTSNGSFGLYTTFGNASFLDMGPIVSNKGYVMNAAWTGSGGSVTESRNGNVVTGSVPQHFISSVSTGLIGIDNGTAFTGSVPEIIVFQTALGTADRQAMENNQIAYYTPPVISGGTVSGTIVACAGTASASPNVQQFTASGVYLTANITATAPTGFEISTTLGSGYSNSLTLTQTNGTVNATIIYVRASAAAATGAIAGNVVLSSGTATSVNVAVSGTVNPLPTATISGTTLLYQNSSAPNITFTGANGTAPYTFTYTINGGSQQTVVSSGNTALVSVSTATAGTFSYTLVSVKDASAALCSATATGSATVTIYPQLTAPGNALGFNAALPTAVTINQTTSVTNLGLSGFTAEAWAYYTSTSGVYSIIRKDGDYNLFIINGVIGAEVWTAGTSSSAWTQTRGTTILPLNRWVHIAAAWDHTAGSFKLYVNGVLETTTNTTPGSQNVSDNLTIGYSPAFGQGFTGKLDEIHIWNTPRTQAQVQSDMTTVSTTPQANLVAYYNFDEGVAGATNTGINTLLDLSGNNNSGTLNSNFALTGTATNWVESYAMVVPTATAATGITGTGFTANWTAPAVGTVTNYLLDVSTSPTFASVVTGSPFTISSPTLTNAVTGLTAGTTYYYRVRADKTSVTGQGAYSNAITLTESAITAGSVTGTIVACIGTASASPNVQQFTVAGTNLTANITATAPTGFEISTVAGSGYSNTVTLTPTGGTVSSTTIFVRASAGAPAGTNSGNVVLVSSAVTVNVAVTGTVNALPAATASNNGPIVSGSSLNLSSSGGTSYSWTGPNSFASTQQNPSIAPVSTVNSGTYTVTVTNANNCVATATTNVVITTVPGAALNFNAAGSNYVNASANTNIPVGNSSYTIEAWIKPTTAGVNAIAGWGNYGTTNQTNVFRLQDATHLVNYWWGNDLSATVPNMTDGNWHHVAATFDGTTRSIYFDGVLKAQDNPTGHNVPSANNLRIGSANPTVGPVLGEFFNGGLDEVRIWNRALCLPEISNNRNCEIATTSNGLVLNYHFNQGVSNEDNTAITNVTDASGNSNNGILTNFTKTGTTSNFIAPGAVTSGVSCTAFVPPAVSISASGPTTFCAGSSVILTATAGSAYLWSTGATTQSITVNTGGNYSVTVVNASGCSATSPVTTVTVNALPTATITAGSATTFCAGGSVVLTASAGSSYLWSNNATTQSITVNTTGNYSVTVTNSNNCSATSAATAVTVNALPTATTAKTDVSCSGGSDGTITVTAATGTAPYQYSNDGGITYQSSNIFSGLAAGTYNVVVKSATTCVSASTVVVIGTTPDVTAPSLVGVPSNTTAECSSVPAIATVTATDNCAVSGSVNAEQFPSSTVHANLLHAFSYNTDGSDSKGSAAATNVNGVTFTPGITNNAAQFNGSNYFSYGTTASLNGTIPFAISVWVKTALASGQTIIQQRDGNINGQYMLNIGANHANTVSAPGQVYFMVYNGTFQFEIYSSGRVDDNKWHHIVAERDGTNGRIYIDGVLAGSATGPLASLTSTITTYVGRDLRDNTKGFVGQLDELKIFAGSGTNCISKYDLERTWSVSDLSGNQTAAQQILSVQDTQAPVLSAAPSNVTIQCSDPVPVAATLTATDNCDAAPVVTFAEVRTNGANASNYTLTRTWTATDACGNVSSKTQTITVQDTQLPVITAPSTVTVTLTNGNCTASGVALGTPVTSDNCGVASVTNNAPSTYPLGNTTVTWTVKDISGNTATATQTVTVVSPEINITGNSISIVNGDVTPSTSDNTDFGGTLPATPITKTFTIQNLGTSPLTVSSIGVSGTNAAEFTVSGISFPATIAAGSSTNFIVTFNSTSVGYRIATITVNNNDCDEASYGFAVQAQITCTAPSFSNVNVYIQASTSATSCDAVVTYPESVNGIPAPAVTYTFSGATTGTGSGTGSGQTFNAGITHVVLSATNPCGTVTSAFDVTVVDDVKPIAVPKNITIYLDQTGHATYNVADLDNGSHDNCGPVTLALDHGTICGTAAEGSTVFLQAPAGKTIDNIDFASYGTPNGSCGNFTLGGCNASNTMDVVSSIAIGQNSASIAASNSVFGDPCGGTVKRLYIQASYGGTDGITNTFTCSNLGANTVTYIVTDAAGNATTATSIVTVVDRQGPTISAPDVYVNTTDPSQCGVIANFAATATDCTPGINTLTYSPNTGTFFNIGSTQVTVTATDVLGNVSTAQFNVIVSDVSGPVITVPTPISVNNDPGQCGAVVSFAATATDCSGVSSITYSKAPGSSFPIGTSPVVVTATDVLGNVSTATFNITVTDNEPPVITSVPANISVSNDKDSCGAVVNYATPVVVDNCGGLPTTKTFTYTGAQETFTVPAGVTSISIDMSGAAGGQAMYSDYYGGGVAGAAPLGGRVQATMSVTPGQVFYLNVGGAGQSTSAPYSGGAGGYNGGGNGTGDSYTISGGGGGGSDIRTGSGLETRIAVAGGGGGAGYYQNGGNGGDLIGAVAYGYNDPAYGGTQDNGGIGADYYGYYNGANYIAANGGFGYGGNAATYAPGGGGGAGWYGGGGGAYSNGGGGSSYTDPSLSGVQHTQGYNNGNGVITLSWILPTTFVQTTGLPSGATFPVGTTTNTFKATDGYGNSSQASFTVTVTDNQKPVLACPSNITHTADAGTCGYSFTPATPAASDNCPGVTVAGVRSDALALTAAYPVGTTTITWTATDAHSNTAVCLQTITVTDNEKPVIHNLPANITVNALNNNCSNFIVWTKPTATDNCGIASLTSSDPMFDAFGISLQSVGVTTVTYTATDIHGNQSTASFTVTVVDNQPPVITGCPSNITVNAATGRCDQVVSWIVPTATDNCPGVSLSTNHVAGETFPVGVTTVTYTATDHAGLTTVCSFTVTVVDAQKPILTGVPANVTVECNAVPAPVTVTATDNCTSYVPVLYTETRTDGSCPNSYTLTRVWSATDAAGNTGSGTQVITVQDTQAPVLSAAPANTTVECDGVPAPATLTATDNCSTPIVTYTELRTDGSCPNSYTLTRTWTATDACGNASSKTQIITVLDRTAPVLSGVPANITVACDAVPVAAIVTATDNCDASPVVGYAETMTSSACPGNYTLTRVWTAIDACGNSSSQAQVITVQDTKAPVLSAAPADTTVQCDAVPAPATLTATDNCDASPFVIYAQTRTNGNCPNNYTLTRVWTGIDACGNASSKTQVITVIDTQAPVLSAAPANTTVECDAVPAPATLTATDNCSTPTVTYTQTRTDGTCPSSYTLIRTWTATDACGNASSVRQVITVLDRTAPVLSAAPADATVECDAVPTPATLTAIDNCDAAPVVTYTQTRTDGTCPSSYTLTRVWTATDACGNNSSKTQIITVLDRTAPVLSAAPANITVECDAVPAPATLTAIDNCDAAPVVTYTQTRTDGTCPSSYTLTRTWTATDACGNNSSKTQIITVLDRTAPVLSAAPANITVECDAVPAPATLTATDNCDAAPVVTYTQTRASGNCPSNYTLTRTWTATDACGNASSKTQIITVLDRTAPVLSAAPVDTIVECDAVPTAAILTAKDNCDAAPVVTYTEVRTNGSTVNDYVLTRTWTATDACGNASSKVQVITVHDTKAPVITLPPNISTANDATVCGALINFTATATDNCSPVTIYYSKNPGTVFPVGTTVVTVTASDISGNTSTGTFTVIVTDTEKPTITTINKTQVNDTGDCGAVVTVPLPVTGDNCSVASLVNDYTHTADASSHYPVGTTTVNWTVTDIHGNVNTAIQLVTVTDNEKPKVKAPGAYSVANDPGVCGATLATIGVPVTSDNCGVASITNDHPSAFYPVGTTIVTWTVTDIHGNVTDTAKQKITVIDNELPTISVNNLTVNNDHGICGATVSLGTPVTGDNCGVSGITNNHPSAFYPVGTTLVTWTVTDIHGLSAYTVQTVVVKDAEAPTVITQNISVSLGSNGTVSITPAQINSGSTDNCSIATYTLDKTSFTCANVGANTVTLTVVDVNGNTSSKTATVTVVDNIAPTVITKNISVSLGTNGTVSITPSQINNGSTDNCSIASYTLDKTSFNCANVGANTVTLTVIDVNGNTSSKTATVTVVDNIAPIVITQNITVNLGTNGTVSITPAQINNGSTDNCSIASYTLDKTSFTCANVGNNTVTLTVTDVNGNVSTGTAVVTVQDNTAPVVLTQNITVALGSNGTVSITPAQINNGSTDACGIKTITVSPNSFTCANVGANTVTLTVTDVNGNTSTGTAVVTVQDNIAPTAITKNITVALNGSGQATVTPAQVDNGSNDNCSVALSFQCASAGGQNLFSNGDLTSGYTGWTVSNVDNSGGWKATGGNPTGYYLLNSNGAAATDPTIQQTVTGLVPGQWYTISGQRNNIENGAFGNASALSFGVAVDNTVILQLANTGGATWIPFSVQFKATATSHVISFSAERNGDDTQYGVDNLSVVATPPASCATSSIVFNCSNIGVNTVKLVVTDPSGNTATQTATVTVVDNLAPVLSVPSNATVNCGTSTAPSATGTATATDNCGTATVTYSDVTTGNVITRTWKAVDAYSNTATATQTITIVDNIKPVVVNPADITVTCSTLTSPSITGTATATDNCGIPTVTYSDVWYNSTTLLRFWKATDGFGNVSNVINAQTILINDNIKPVITDVPDITVNCGASTLPSATGTATATDNCGTPTVTYSDVTSGNVITRTWKATDGFGNTATSTQVITVGAVFTATVSSVPTSSTYTGGVSTNLYLGYGAQSTTLQMGSLPSAGAPYTYLWSGSYTNKLSSTTAASPVFTPSTFGYYTFSVTVTNKYGCTSTASISICVTDIRVAGTSGIGAQVYVCHVTNVLGHTTYTTLQVLTSILSVYVNSSCGDRLGSCSQSACNTTVANSIVGNNSGITKEGGTEVSTSNDELKVTVMPNPTNTFFTLKLESKYETPVNMRVMDANGRVIDAKSKIGANSTIQIGHNYSSGTYYAELIQGTQRKVVQMIKGR